MGGASLLVIVAHLNSFGAVSEFSTVLLFIELSSCIVRQIFKG